MDNNSELYDGIDFDAINERLAKNAILLKRLEDDGNIEIKVQVAYFNEIEEDERLSPDEGGFSKIELYNVQPGRLVKVIYGGESFWVQIVDVLEINKQKVYVGIVDNDLDFDDINYQSVVFVKPNHIINIW
ncbi:MAG: hypothetical protein HOD92_10880 [Deltaproteobacteria bacterium]|jgi:hypothetical protein|nr:hypothetical protein [Deltaproteobacteria bacterium]